MNVLSRTAILLFLMTGTNFAWSDVVVPVESVENSVNVRFAPDAASEVVGQLRRGAALEYISTEGGWHKVELEGGGTGFVSTDWALVVDDLASVESAGDDAEDNASGDKALDAEPETSAETETEVEVAAVAEAQPEEVAERPDAGESVVTAPEPEFPAEIETLPEAVAELPDESEDAPTVTEPEALAETEAAALADAATDPVDAEPSESLSTEPAALAAVASVPVSFEGSVDHLMKFIAPTEGGSSQVFDNGRNVGIGTTEPQQRLEVNGNIQIHEQNSSVAGLMITQSSGDMGYIMHNRASTLTIGAGSIDRITINRDGNVGFGVNRPSHPVEMASGAHVTAGGVWTNSSSIEKKENVRELTPEEALAALALLEPVRFNYKADDGEEYVGFIAEDVPDLVATSDRTGLSAMDIVAVLTSVVQQQQKKIEALEARLDNP